MDVFQLLKLGECNMQCHYLMANLEMVISGNVLSYFLKSLCV